MISSNSAISKGSKCSSTQDLSLQNSSNIISEHNHSNISKPKKSPRFTKPPTSTGRKFINKKDNQNQLQDDKNQLKINENTTIEELDQMLEDDALILINMKKDINKAQKEELLKLQQVVLNIKKEYDLLRAKNSTKEKYIRSVNDKKIKLNEIEKSDQETNANVNQQAQLLNEQIKITILELNEEQKTTKMLNLMIKRLDSEIGQCRIETGQLVIQADQAKHDATISHTSLVTLRQELLEEETKLVKINTTLKTRKEERIAKIQVLNQMSVDGENSVVRMQQSLYENSKRTEERQKKRYLLLHPPSNRREAWKKLSEYTEEREDEFAGLTDASIAKKLTLNQVKDIIQRYTTQTSRMEKLKQLDIELRNNIQQQEKKKYEFSEHLARTAYRLQQLASKRQVYQEVDLKDFALATTIKECDDCKERDFRLRLSITSLKQSIPRFLSKVTKEEYSLPSELQLPAAIMELVDELTKLIKAIAPALLKDATPDDLALISMQSGNANSSGNNGNDTQSEFDRLQRLPGYSRLQRQLFYNLMTAKTDNSIQNVRIEQIGKVKPPKSTTGPASLYEDPTISPTKGKRLISMYKSNAHNQSEDDYSKHSHSNDISKTSPNEQPTLGRKTIKNISKLIYDRDHNKVSSNIGKASKLM